MKIVVLDGYALNPGDLNWENVGALGDLTVYDRSMPGEVLPRAEGAEILLTNKTVLNRETLAALPDLKFISVLATGYNVVDIDAAKERRIPVSNVPTYGTRSVAQMTFALILELTNRVGHHSRTVSEGKWSSSIDFCYWDYPLVELDGLTLGIVGYGRIGQAVADVGRALGMKIIVYSIPQPTDLPNDVAFCPPDELFSSSDVVSLHCPLTPQTEHIADKRRLELMKRTAYLINTSRGPLVDAGALTHALNNDIIAGAALDVMEQEPPPADDPLLTAKNCYVTPHISWATRAARIRLMEVTVDNINAFLSGKSQNVVNS